MVLEDYFIDCETTPEPDDDLAMHLADLGRRLRPRGLIGPCSPYVIAPDGTILTKDEDPAWPAAKRAVLYRDHARQCWYLGEAFAETLPLQHRYIVEVHHTVGPAFTDAKHRHGSERKRREDRWIDEVYAALTAGPQAWPSWEFPGGVNGTAWIMVRILTYHQGGVCAVCRELAYPIFLDHDHRTMMVRGALCRPCNSFEGHDDAHDLAAFAAYRADPPAAFTGWVYPRPRRF
ncbi:MAG: endonuclease domain-containing protein [Dehalococcoidia bacterium]